MAFSTDFRTPAQLTGIARGTIEGIYGSSLVSQYLPYATNDGLTFDFQVGDTSLPTAAKFRSYNTESDVAAAPVRETRTGKLPPISRRLHVDEYAKLQLQGGDLGATFEDYTRKISAEIALRFVQGAAEAIETGKLTINERGLAFELDYGRNEALTANAAQNWDNAEADILADLEALRAVYGRTPGTLVMSDLVLRHLGRNADVLARIGGGSYASQEDVRSVLGAFGFTSIVVNDERLVDSTGVERPLFDPKKVLFLPGSEPTALSVAMGTGSLGTTDFGIAAESLSPENGVGGTAGAFAGAIAGHDPEGYNVLVSAIGLPIVQNANATAALTVLS